MIVRKLDDTNMAVVKEICKNCGNKTVKDSFSFMGLSLYRSPSKCFSEVFDNVAFYFCVEAKKHLRLIELAVKNDSQYNGYGKAVLLHIMHLGRLLGKEKITLRVTKTEPAVHFWKKHGAVQVGENGNDFEMEILL